MEELSNIFKHKTGQRIGDIYLLEIKLIRSNIFLACIILYKKRIQIVFNKIQNNQLYPVIIWG